MLRSQRSREGYLLIDHSASPGTASVPEGARLEASTMTCSHCNRVVLLNPMRTRDRGFCFKCNHYVCDSPECNIGCNPISKQLDDLERSIMYAQARGHERPVIVLPDTMRGSANG